MTINRNLANSASVITSTGGNLSTSGLFYSTVDGTGGTGIALTPQVYSLTANSVPSTTIYPTYTKFFPVVINLAAGTKYEVNYKLWLDGLSTNLTGYWGFIFSGAPVNCNVYSKSQYAVVAADGTGSYEYIKTAQTGTTIDVGTSKLYTGTPAYLEIISMIDTNASAATTLTLGFGTSISGYGTLLKSSYVMVTKMPSSVGTFS